MQYNQTLCPILLERHTGNHMQVPAIYLKYVHRKYAVKCLVWNFVRKNPPNIESNINEISYFGKYSQCYCNNLSHLEAGILLCDCTNSVCKHISLYSDGQMLGTCMTLDSDIHSIQGNKICSCNVKN